MSNIAHFRKLREENSSVIPTYWIYQSINPVFKLLPASQIALNKSKSGIPASILRKSTSGRHRPVSYPDGPMAARYRFT